MTNQPTTKPLPPDAQWATEGYSYVVTEGRASFVYVLAGGTTFTLWDVDWETSEAFRKARKAGNRLRRMYAPVH